MNIRGQLSRSRVLSCSRTSQAKTATRVGRRLHTEPPVRSGPLKHQIGVIRKVQVRPAVGVVSRVSAKSNSTTPTVPHSRRVEGPVYGKVGSRLLTIPRNDAPVYNLVPARRKLPLPRVPQLTLVAKYPSSTTKEDILKSLRSFYDQPRQWRRSYTVPQAVVILATPKFASLLHDQAFVSSALSNVVRDVQSLSAKLDVVCACVDGLSPHMARMAYAHGRPVSEGISICQGRTMDMLPGLHHSNALGAKKDASLLSTLTFLKQDSSTNITLPLANTLFTTGEPSILTVGKWEFRNNSFVQLSSTKRDNVNIRIFSDMEAKFPLMKIPLAPLMPVRRITSGLGNIVRQLDFGEHGVGPASKELEEAIGLYSVTKDRQGEALSVWALVSTTAQLDTLPERAQKWLYDQKLIREKWAIRPPSALHVAQLISSGAALCRVVSGGGGWGPKQGLLSLDPQTAYGDTSSSRYSLAADSQQEEYESAVGNLAKPGAWIQFFVGAPPKAEMSEPNFVEWIGRAQASYRRTVVIGTAPSTVDNVLTPEGKKSLEIGDITIHSNLFGCLSESGMFLRLSPQGTTQETSASSGTHESEMRPTASKIDLPFTYFYEEVHQRRGWEPTQDPPSHKGRLATEGR